MSPRHALPLLVCLIALSACLSAGAGERTQRVQPKHLVNTGGWELRSARGNAEADALVAPGVAFEMRFEDGLVTASGGCNNISGSYTVSGKRLTFDLAIVTRMSCTDTLNLADRSFVELLNRGFDAVLVEPQPYRLRLTGAGGEALEFQAKPVQLD